ncbi:hypothetical protein [Streptomyces fulvorobeus]|uniref:Uncharacterized protein YjbJ (UPF0337 family) n=1 Tax=Streptomyces fulvorobeus TaxID=284028 RepID=A0A7J0CED8_9ACTN|nr:hypothetical protein [Streptomyces fulvorobeus]NYE44336.1 uncharacterized protein YjbJ (UPF0337 family) [Streptomyces fulvorobeus]GFN00860.1 hypothetical protein Sfulv_56700 [Streptomyces fulvorobeus]
MSDFDGSSRGNEESATVARTARDKVGEGAGLVGEKATETAGTAREQAAGVAGEAAAKAQDLAGELRDRLQDQASSQTQRVAESIRRLSDELRDMSDNAKEDSSAASAVRQIADRGQRVAAHLESRGPEGLMGDLQEFARRRPGAFLAGAALAGFAVARIGKGIKSADSGGGSGTPSPGGTDRAQAPGPPYAYEAGGPGDRHAPPPSTPSYGGSVTTPGPVPVAGPYPDPIDPDQRQP